MKLTLKEFQQEAVELLYRHARDASRDVNESGLLQAVVLSSPTGSGKTMIATRLLEIIVEGDGTFAGDRDACFLWITDQPELNEQTRRKIEQASSVFDSEHLTTIDSFFDESRFRPGCVYFLNTQKVGREKQLVTRGDLRKNSIWDTITQTVAETPASFWVVVDEAHKGMAENAAETKLAQSIVQKFIKGSSGEIPATPLVLGISATPKRFLDLLGGTSRVMRPKEISPEEVRDSGLLKDVVSLYRPKEKVPSDQAMLQEACAKLAAYEMAWLDYSTVEKVALVNPILVVQVEDAGSSSVTKTDLNEALVVIGRALGPLSDKQIAHSFQEHNAIKAGGRSIRYVAPADIEDDDNLRVVFFKRSLNTGWDCPRAEVMMSFRRALDHTLIAQLIGRMVRTPLARRIGTDAFLNTVSLYLPHYDQKGVNNVVNYLSSPELGVGFALEVEDGSETVYLERNVALADLFEKASTLPTYTVERVAKVNNTRRLIRLARALAYDKIDTKAAAAMRTTLVKTLARERTRLVKSASFQNIVQQSGHIPVEVLNVVYGADEQTFTATTESIALVEENVNDLFEQAARRLGEGLHVEYVKAQRNGRPPSEMKLELFALVSDEKVLSAVEKAAAKRFDELYAKHQVAINQVLDERRQLYRKLRRQAARPVADELDLPQTIPAKLGEQSWPHHLYADENGAYPAYPKLNGWEQEVLTQAFAEKGFLGWLRNEPRKRWALTIPYKQLGQDRPLYPDILVFRKAGGEVVVDIIEPHSIEYEDSADKAVGLAEYAYDHGDAYGRIELIFKHDGRFKRINVNDPQVGAKVRPIKGNEGLIQLVADA